MRLHSHLAVLAFCLVANGLAAATILPVIVESPEIPADTAQAFQKALESVLRPGPWDEPTCKASIYDFSSLTKEVDYDASDPDNPNMKYYFNVCARVNRPGPCRDSSAMICQIDAEGHEYNLGRWYYNPGPPTWITNTTRGISLMFKNGPPDCFVFPQEISRTTLFTFTCGCGKPVVYENPQRLCNYDVTFPIKELCPGQQCP